MAKSAAKKSVKKTAQKTAQKTDRKAAKQTSKKASKASAVKPGKKAAAASAQKNGKKAGPKTAAKTATKTTPKASAAAASKSAALKNTNSNIIDEINRILEDAVEMTLEVGDMEVGENGVKEGDLEDAVARLAAVRKKAWDLLMTTFPDLIDRLMFTEMIEAAYEGEEAGSIRFAGSAVGWDEVGGQFVLLGRTGDVWEGEGRLLEAVMTAENPEIQND